MYDSHIKLISSFWYAEIAKQLEFASFSILYRHVSMCLDWPPLKTIYYFSPHDFFKIMKYSVVFSTANLKLAISHILMFGSSHDAKANLFSFFKVQLFWEGHNNLPCGFDIYLVNVKTVRQIAQIFVAFSEKLNFEFWCDSKKIFRARSRLAYVTLCSCWSPSKVCGILYLG